MQNRITSAQILDILRMSKTHDNVEKAEIKAGQELGQALMTTMMQGEDPEAANEQLEAADEKLEAAAEKFEAAKKAHADLHEVMNNVPEEDVISANNLLRTVAQQSNDQTNKFHNNGVREVVAQAMPHLSNMFAQQAKQAAVAARAAKAEQDLNASTESDCSPSPKM